MQVIVPPVAMTCGGRVSAATTVPETAVHPLGDVAVTTYVPAVFTPGLSRLELKFCGPLHITPAVAGDRTALRPTEFCKQDSVPPETVICGGVVSSKTVAVAVAVQPFGS